MPGWIEDYLQGLLSTAGDCAVISSSTIQLDKRTPRAGFIRGDISFVDASRLYFRELVELQEKVYRRMYSYHYQDRLEILIFRYDDTPHYPDLDNCPHHKHVKLENTVISSINPDFSAVLKEIESLLAGKRKYQDYP